MAVSNAEEAIDGHGPVLAQEGGVAGEKVGIQFEAPHEGAIDGKVDEWVHI